MADRIDEEILKWNIQLDPKKAIQEMAKFNKSVVGTMKKADKETKALDKGVMSFFKHMSTAKQHAKAVDKMNVEYQALKRTIKQSDDAFKAMRKQASAMPAGSKQRRALVAQMKSAKASSMLGERRDAAKKVGQRQKELEGMSGYGLEDLKEKAEEAGNRMSAPLEELFQRDAPAMFKRASNLLGKTIHKIGESGSRGLGLLAGAAGKKGDALMAKGGVSKLGGMGFKGVESLAKSLAPVVETLTKLGPALTIGASLIAGFVKILLNAEQAAKDYNKAILATTSTSKYLRKSFGGIEEGSKALGNALYAAQDGGTKLAFRTWGITKEMSQAYQSAIAQEGVALDRLTDTTKDLKGQAKGYADTIVQAVTYSRAFGVSLSEIAQFQGEMMSNLGVGAKGSALNFQRISDAAADAGVEANKFFGIVRSFSADLSLFTLRLGDVAKMLGSLSKTMDPRKAQQFMQELSNKFTGGDVQENLRMVKIIGKDNVTKVLNDDLNSGIDSIVSALKEALAGTENMDSGIKELISLIRDPKRNPNAIPDWMAKHQDQKEKLQPILSQIFEAANQQTKISSKDEVELASALAHASQMSVVKLQALASKSVNKGKDVNQARGINRLGTIQSGIASESQIEATQSFQNSLRLGISELTERISHMDDQVMRNGEVTKRGVSTQDQGQLRQLGITNTSREGILKDLQDKLKGDAGLEAYFKSLGQDQKALVAGMNQEVSFQKQTSEFQVSVQDQMGIVADAIQNSIFNVLESIKDGVMTIVDILSFKGDVKRAQAAAFRTGDPRISKALEGTKDSNEAAQHIMKDVVKDLVGKLQKFSEEYKGIRKSLETETDPKKRQALLDRAKQLRPVVSEYGGKGANYFAEAFKTSGLVGMINRTNEVGKAVNRLANPSSTTPTVNPAVQANAVAPASQVAPHGAKPTVFPTQAPSTGGMVQELLGKPATTNVVVHMSMNENLKQVVDVRSLKVVQKHQVDSKKR